jgi:hypothetical protein
VEDSKTSHQQHWSADFVEHIRAVHFSLIAVCAALIGISLYEKPVDVNTAAAQLQDMKAAVASWESYEVKGVLKDAFSRAAKGQDTMTPRFVDIEEAHLGIDIGPVIQLPTGSPYGDGIMGSTDFVVNLLNKPPTSVDSFCNLWDLLFLQPTVILPDPSGLAAQVIVMKASGATEIRHYRDGVFGGTFFTSLRPATNDEVKALSSVIHAPVEYVYWFRLGNDTAFLPAAATTYKMDGQAALIRSHPYWKRGLCTTSFGGLMNAMSGLHGRSFEAVEEAFKQEVNKPKTDTFEIFGVKFPVDAALQWGIILILAIQLYLWVQLYELSPRLKSDDPGWEVAWIGVYRSAPARCLFIALTVALPSVTVVLLEKNSLAGAGAGRWLLYSSAALLSLFLSVLTVRWSGRTLRRRR